MPSLQSKVDVKRYLEVTRTLKSEKVNSLILINGSEVFCHQGESLFDQLPVSIEIIHDPKYQGFYAVSHKDGDLYIQSIQSLRTAFNDNVKSDNDYLYDIQYFQKLNELIKNYDANKYCPLHTHSAFSSLDGFARAEDYARRAKQLGFPAMAITDHGTMAGIIPFYKACKKYGIKPILGQEFYIDDDRNIKGIPEKVGKGMKGEEKKKIIKIYMEEHRILLRRHLVLLAKSEIGLKNLYKLSTIGFLEGYHRRPRIDWDVLKQYGQEIIALTACTEGIMGEPDERYKVDNLRKLVSCIGAQNVFLEAQLITYEHQPKHNDCIFNFSEKYGLPVVVTTDSHYVDPDPDHVHRLYMQIGAGFSYGEGHNYLKTYTELYDTFNEFFKNKCHYNKWELYNQALKNTFTVANQCNVEIELGKFKLPQFKLDEAWDKQPTDTDNQKYLGRRLVQGWQKKIVPLIQVNKIDEKVYRDRLIHEVKTFFDAGYDNYLLMELDQIDNAKRVGNFCNVRGSAAGSLVLYLLDMTKLDPMKYDLLFERFVSPLRAGLIDKSYQSPPDIDCDFASRDNAVAYLEQKYGKENVVRIGTYNRTMLKSAMKQMAKMTEFMSDDDANQLTKTIGDTANTLDKALKDSEVFRAWYSEEKNKKWFDKYVEPVVGLESHGGIHAAGVIIAPGPVVNYMPLRIQTKKKETNDTEGRLVVTQFEGDAAEDIGLLKYDELGVETLTRLEYTAKLIKEREGTEIDFEKIDLENPMWYEQGFKKADCVGIFQLGTPTSTRLCKLVQPENFSQLMDTVSLSRPGTSGPGMDMEYCERKNTGKPFQYDHPALEPVLKKTFGICCYQESVMKMCNIVGGLSLVEADKIRKIMKKKDLSAMMSYREKFVSGAVERGIESREEAINIWKNNVESYSSYGFCAAHAATYAQMAVWGMALKILRPLEFYVGLLENPPDTKKTEYLQTVFKDIKQHGLDISMPDVNRSGLGFRLDGNTIIWSLVGVKNVGEKEAAKITENAPYSSMQDFVDRSKANKRAVDSLLMISAFSWYQNPRDAAVDYYAIRKLPLPPELDVQNPKYWGALFYRQMGFYIHDPMEMFGAELQKYGKLDTYEEFLSLSSLDGVKIAGNITSYNLITTKRKKEQMVIMRIEVEYNTIPVVLWPSFFKKHSIRKMKKDDVIGSFCYIFGERNYGLQSEPQITLSYVDEHVLEIL